VSAPKINLLVGDGAAPPVYVMPNLTGQPLGSAMLALQDAGIKAGKVSVLPPASAPTQPGEPQAVPVAPSAASGPSAASMIVSQTPAPGQKVVAGSAVNFEVR
jgi:beta-lactam-binding protein with PASTA domain